MKLFERFGKKLKNVHASQVDPSKFGDPVALKTEWTPKSKSSSSFKTHILVQIQPQRIEFKSTWGIKAFGLFFLAGSFMPINDLLFSNPDDNTTGKIIFLSIITLLFFGFGFWMIYESIIPIVFDTQLKYFWKGWKPPNRIFNIKELKCYALIEDIHALQLLSKSVSSDGGSYKAYELNIVLNDGSRLHVIGHGNGKVLQYDANTLAKFINKPLWDAT